MPAQARQRSNGRDPTIVARIWPIAEAFTALVLLDNLMMHYGYQTLRGKVQAESDDPAHT